jgi:hypothetical protein
MTTTIVIFRLLAAGAAVISLSAAAAEGKKQQPQPQSQSQSPSSADTSAASIAAASNPRGGPSSSSERTAEPAPGGYGPPAGEPPRDKTK